MADPSTVVEMKRTLTLTGVTVNAMALIAPGAFLWTTFQLQAAQSVMDNAFSPLSDMRASTAYRRIVARNLLLKCFLETSEEAAVTRLAPA